jgi:hypothetical protein
MREQVLKRDNFTCYWCGISGRNIAFQIDHVVPVSWGGVNDLANLVTACPSCNLKKGASVTGALGKTSGSGNAFKPRSTVSPRVAARQESREQAMPKLPRDLEQLRKGEIDLARKRQQLREKELNRLQKTSMALKDKDYVKRERELAKKRLRIEEEVVENRLRQLEKQRKRNSGCCLLPFSLMSTPFVIVVFITGRHHRRTQRNPHSII